MSRYHCTCGHTWSDVAVPNDGYPNQGWLLRDQDAQAFMDRVSENVASFIEALLTGKRTEWLVGYFGTAEPWEQDAMVVNDILLRVRRELFVFQCENCGRLWLQEAPDVGSYRSCMPEGEWKDSLATRPSPKLTSDL